ncbi:hypothetical protein [Streptomyces sp. NPDC048349]|uniref:hypothetical protein n=1 Tax=Streptomyces sp. NPDC048349 TaxID=3155486 RepID=UPI00343DC100
MTDADSEVLEVEIVEDELLPATVPHPSRPLVDQHTILYPGDALPTEADAPTYTRADFEVSAATADRLRNKAAPANTNRNYSSQRKNFAEWCAAMGRVARPCTTAAYVERVTGLIARGMAPNTIRTYMSGVRTWRPRTGGPGRPRRGGCWPSTAGVGEAEPRPQGPGHHRVHAAGHGRHL